MGEGGGDLDLIRGAERLSAGSRLKGRRSYLCRNWQTCKGMR